jgi:hypothetical protein
MYRVLLERGAERDLARLSSENHDRVIAAIQGFANDSALQARIRAWWSREM